MFHATLPSSAANRDAIALEKEIFDINRDTVRTIYQEKLKIYVKFNSELNNNFGIAISILLSLLSPQLRNIVGSQAPREETDNEVIFYAYMTYLIAHYSLNSTTDVLAINTRLQSVRTRHIGVRNAIYVLNSGFNALTGIVVGGVSNAPTPIAKKTFLLNALTDDNVWSSLVMKYSSETRITYETMVAELNHAVDTNPAFDPFLKEPFDLLSMKIISDKVSGVFHTDAVLPPPIPPIADEYNASVNYVCINCLGNHVTTACSTTTCHHCGTNFASSNDRIQHYRNSSQCQHIASRTSQAMKMVRDEFSRSSDASSRPQDPRNSGRVARAPFRPPSNRPDRGFNQSRKQYRPSAPTSQPFHREGRSGGNAFQHTTDYRPPLPNTGIKRGINEVSASYDDTSDAIHESDATQSADSRFYSEPESFSYEFNPHDYSSYEEDE
jgi:hypothetical protein